MDGIILREVNVSGGTVDFRFETKGKIKDFFTTDRLSIEYQQDITGIPKSILTIPFVACILPLMWLTDTVMWVEELDRTFYDAVSKIRDAYQRLYEHYDLKGNLVAAKLVENSYKPEKESLLLFSGGIDANTTYLRIKETNPYFFNIQGFYKEVNDYNKESESEVSKIGEFATREGVNFSYAKSNFALLIDNKVFSRRLGKKFRDSWWHGFQHSMAFISISIPLAYLLKIRNVYIASSVPMGEYVMCASHVTTDSEFKFAQYGGCVHDGSELTRQDKVHVIVDYVNKHNIEEYPLQVCSFNDHNCCACDKCFRSILAIVAEGGDIDKFGFHINAPLKDYFANLMDTQIIKFNISGESKLHWPATRKRMKENYDRIKDREFVDWFLSYDFLGQRKKALRQYYRKNFFSILKRKIFH